MKFSIAIFISLMLGLAGCGKGPEFDASSTEAQSVAKSPATMPSRNRDAQGAGAAGPMEKANDASPQLAANVIQNRMVIRRADLTLRVESVEKAERSVQRIIGRFGGYVESANSSDLDSQNPTLTVAMRVPAQSFDQAMSEIESLGVRMSKSVSSEDVTEQVVDIDARLRSMRAQEETYRGLLRRATRLDDVITMQQHLTNIRGQIESMMAQRKSLADQAALSSISLTLTQSAVANKPPKDPNWLAQTWAESTTQMGGMLRSLAAILIWAIVFSPLWAPILWLIMRAAKPTRSKPVPPYVAEG